MVFSTNIFLFLFLPIVLMVYYNPLIRNRRFRNFFLVLASLGFYAWGEPVYVLLMIESICMNYGIALLIEHFRRKRILFLVISLIYNLGVLFIFKYLPFMISLVFGKEVLEIALPIGISFYTFQAMSYVIDVYRGTRAERNIINVALYISLFPQLIAGPIVRYQQIEKEIRDRKENFRCFSYGVNRFIVGLAKKVIIANNVARIADEAFKYVGTLSVAMAWLGAIAYALQIYYDFSGYSDMAIGLGRMFGFHICENFKYPYISCSITEFWRRWHISLSGWFRDYVYIPLGGNRCSKKRNLLNLGIVWLLTGIWHGANWTFWLWGLLYFMLLAIEKTWKWMPKIKYFNRIYTMVAVILLWVLFRADTVGQAIIYMENMFNVMHYEMINERFWNLMMNFKVYIVIGVLGVAPIACCVYKKLADPVYRKGYQLLRIVVTVVIFVVTITYMVADTYNPFIYFNF